MVLGGPHAVETKLVHVFGQGLRIAVGFDQFFVGVTPFVGGCAINAGVFKIDLADVQD